MTTPPIPTAASATTTEWVDPWKDCWTDEEFRAKMPRNFFKHYSTEANTKISTPPNSSGASTTATTTEWEDPWKDCWTDEEFRAKMAEARQKQDESVQKLKDVVEAFNKNRRDEEIELAERCAKLAAAQAENRRMMAKVDTTLALVLTKMVANERARGDPWDSGVRSTTSSPPDTARPMPTFRPGRSRANQGDTSSGKHDGGTSDLQ